MRPISPGTAAALSIAAAVLAGCSTTSTPSVSTPAASTASDNRPAFHTEIRDGRLWVFREGSKELAQFKSEGEPAHQVTRIGGGPNGMTIKSHDAAVIDEYLAAR